MKKICGLFAISMALALFFTGCQDPTKNNDGDDGEVTIAVKSVSVQKPGSGVVIATVPEIVYVGAEPVTYLATVLPANASDKTVVWDSENPAVATVDEGVITAVEEGTTKITVTTNGKKADGNASTFSFTVKVEIDPNNIPAYLRIYTMANAAAGYTADKGNVPAGDFNAQGRLLVSNKTTTSGWGTETQKVNGNTFVYLTRPLDPPFSISARVKITSLTAAAGTDNGFFVGAFSDPTVDTQVTPAAVDNIIYLAGLNTATTGRRSVYATRDSGGTNNSATGTTQFIDRTDKEYQFIVSRTDAVYNLNIKDDAQAGAPSHTPYPEAGINRGANSTPATEIHPELAGTKPVFVGIMISGVDVEISSIIIKQGDDVIYSSPAATATPIPAATSVTITNNPTENVVSVGDAIGMTATVSPAEALQTVTWSIDPPAPLIATIDADTGVVTGLGAGSVQVYAAAASAPTVKSAAFTVTVSLEQEVIENNRNWNFQKQPTGVVGESYFMTDIYYGQGMTLLGSNRANGIAVRVGWTNPGDIKEPPIELSVGCLQPNGTVPDGYARIDDVQGPFDITLKYEADGAGPRYTTIKIKPENAAEYNPGIDGTASASARDNVSFTYSYVGTDKVTVLLVANVNPGKITDVIIDYKGN